MMDNYFLKRKEMIRSLLLILSCMMIFLSTQGQEKMGEGKDSTLLKGELSEVVVKAFEQEKKLSNQSAAIAYISGKTLNRFNSLNVVSAMNSVPGVRMEQRSPGSVRLNIRGSSLRAPFGVRNVKVYYNGIPFTDPGGNTYLNQLSFKDYGSIEVIKGPSGSLYGAGMGGAAMIKSPLFSGEDSVADKVKASFGVGSFGLKKGSLSLCWNGENSANEIRYSDITKDGYRNHTRLRHQTADYDTRIKLNDRQELDAFVHYTNLYYQTPGGLTLAQFKAHPKSSRPASGNQPSAEESKAAVHQKAFMAGIKQKYQFNHHFTNTTALYGAYTDFTNPTTRNFEYRKEPHFGGRTVFEFQRKGRHVHSKYWLGAEIQQGYFDQKDFGNNEGKPDSLQIIAQTNEFNALIFGQGEWTLPKGWDISAAFSLNHQNLQFNALYPDAPKVFKKKYPLIFTPRVALSKKITPHLLIYAQVSKGFSPPTVAEILPSTNILNKNLHAEQGLNYEIGSKGQLLKGRFYYELNAFVTHLTQSISQRRDSTGADYFVNAGGSWQKGVETFMAYDIYRNRPTFFRNVQVWLSQTVFDFHYENYISGDRDYSHNKVPGAVPYTLVSGIDVETKMGLEMHLVFQHSSKMALNDENDAFSSPYDLLGLKFSYQKKLRKQFLLHLSAGGDNLLNQQYSLGDDLNAFGGRYFNPAPTINFYANVGLEIGL